MTVTSVTGPVTLDDSGAVLAHEHLVIDYRQMRGGATPASRAQEDACVALLTRAREAGIQATVDCTPPGYGRDLAFLRSISRRSGMTIIASTGTFCEQWHPQPPWAAAATADELADAFVAELGRDCGVIKVATSYEPTPLELKALDAAACAHRETGSPIVCHTTGGYGIDAVGRLTDAGVAPDAVLVSHVCADAEPLDYAVEIARLGAYVGLDRIGHAAHDDDHWLSVIAAVRDAGHADRILLAHDSVQSFHGPDAIAGHTFSDPLYLTGPFARRARAGGMTADELHALTTTNPVSWLTAKERPL